MGTLGQLGDLFSDFDCCVIGVIAVCPPVALLLVLMNRTKVKAPEGDSSKCRKCGYDLSATPDRCPECGTFVRRFRKWTDHQD
jgi:primosomal protein N'